MAPILPSGVVLTSKPSHANETHLVSAESTYYIHEVGSSLNIAHAVTLWMFKPQFKVEINGT